jgi:S-DNA-T family DNA segregation ATPase FtsK/SpoIIIE
MSALAPWKLEIAGLALVLVAAGTGLALSDLPLGKLASAWGQTMRQAFGWGAWIVALTVAFAGLHLALRRAGRPWRVTLPQIIGVELLFLALLALTHLPWAAESEEALYRAAAGRGGGYVGWAMSIPLADGVGALIAGLLLGLLGLYGAALVFRFKPQDLKTALATLSLRLDAWAEAIQRSSSGAEQSGPGTQQDGRTTKAPVGKPSARSASTVQPPGRLTIARTVTTGAKETDRPSHLPPMDLLEPGLAVEYSEEEIRDQAGRIERTLLDFGVPVKVVEVRRGPTVTQYGVAPLYREKAGADGELREHKVRVSQITALTHDLELALAATSIRVEAPVPGRPVVGIEVPNSKEALVRLRTVLESEQFRRVKSPLAIGLGLDVSGTPIVGDLAKMPHLLIAGTTGSGKSVCINTITTCLVCNNRPEELKLVMIDPKMVELVRFNGLPHLLGKVEVELERVIGVLRWMTVEMDQRYKTLAEAGARNVGEYNRAARRRRQWSPLPLLVLIIDELADLIMMAPEEVEHTMVRLAQMARAVGIHLVVATQRPSTDVVTGLIKANFPARISFAVASSIDSRVVLDGVGAESLLGKGDMLFQQPDAPKPVRLQGCFVSDLEIERVVSFWLHQTGSGTPPSAPPWEEFTARQSISDGQDPLLERVIQLAEESDTISASVIQRRLRIGYPRAARLMETLEERGVVGSGQTGGRPREVLKDRDTPQD